MASQHMQIVLSYSSIFYQSVCFCGWFLCSIIVILNDKDNNKRCCFNPCYLISWHIQHFLRVTVYFFQFLWSIKDVWHFLGCNTLLVISLHQDCVATGLLKCVNSYCQYLTLQHLPNDLTCSPLLTVIILVLKLIL